MWNKLELAKGSMSAFFKDHITNLIILCATVDP